MAASCVSWCVTEIPGGLSCKAPLCSALCCTLWNVLHRAGAFQTKNGCNWFTWKETPLGGTILPASLRNSVRLAPLCVAESAVVTHVTPKAKLQVAQIAAEQALGCFRLHELGEPWQLDPRVIQPLVSFQTAKPALVSTALCFQGLQWGIWVVWLHGIAVLVHQWCLVASFFLPVSLLLSWCALVVTLKIWDFSYGDVASKRNHAGFDLGLTARALAKLDVLHRLILPCLSSLSLSPHSKPECLGTRLPISILLHFAVPFWHQGKPTWVILVSFGLLPPLLSVKEQWEQKALCTAVGEKAGYQPFPRLFPFALYKGNLIFPSLFHSFRNNKETRIGATGLYLLMVWWGFSLELLSPSCVSKH